MRISRVPDEKKIFFEKFNQFNQLQDLKRLTRSISLTTDYIIKIWYIHSFLILLFFNIYIILYLMSGRFQNSITKILFLLMWAHKKKVETCMRERARVCMSILWFKHALLQI